MKLLKTLLLLSLLFMLVACGSDEEPEDAPAPAATAVAETVDEPASTLPPPTIMATEAPTGLPTAESTATVAPTAEPTAEPTATVEPTAEPDPTETPTGIPTPDIPGSWAQLQADLSDRILPECPVFAGTNNIFLHVPGFVGEDRFCNSFMAFGQGFITSAYDPDFSIPGDREVDVMVSLFQANAADDQFMELVAAIKSGAEIDAFTNYSVLLREQVAATCRGSECTAPLANFLLAPNYTIACLTFTMIGGPGHTAIVCLVPSMSP